MIIESISQHDLAEWQAAVADNPKPESTTPFPYFHQPKPIPIPTLDTRPVLRRGERRKDFDYDAEI